VDPRPTGNLVRRIISGGQTGVDRGALDAAIALGIDHGGWCPRGRLAEDGKIPRQYRLKETQAREYWVRTEQNVVDSDGTLILYRGQLSGGTEFTYRMTRKHGKPSLRVDLAVDAQPHAARRWIEQQALQVLNVAGPRESSAPGIAQQACAFLQAVLTGGK
jgi:hypothetical protein